ncbi:MAG: alpha-L-rhamnosidase C-terminal domain-containing protein [Verrucomicrobiae bacterium]|nr:alpha-L-rhamnosidase C-terminal domain-containing protein [Verrucomicrobiae bacterium]
MNHLPDHHPLRRATWIWPQYYLYLINHYAQFRRDFVLPRTPSKAPFFITADKAYRLYVNGRPVCRGPARGYQSHWPFDEVDLAAFLRRGRNWIAVEAYNPGISTFQYLHHTKAGFLCAARWGGFELVSDLNWQMRRSPAHAVHTARFSIQLDFQEHVDASKDDRAWIYSPQPPKGWEPRILPAPAQHHISAPFGQTPYDLVEPRGIPLLREEWVLPARICAQTTGENGAGFEDWENVSWGWVEEVRGRAVWSGGEGAGAPKGGMFEWDMPPAGRGKFRAMALELPYYVVGNLDVEVKGGVGGEILDFHFAEGLVDGRPALHAPGAACMIALANRLRLRKGTVQHEFFHHLGFRIVTVVGRNIRKPLAIRVRVRNIGYPFAMRGIFECSDPELNRIHAACRRTQQICALDAYVDTPWREQAQWWGDARVQARNTFYLDGDARLLARGIRSIAGQPGPWGLTFGHAPTSAHGCVLPDFALTWILTIWDYYWQTGDISLFNSMWPRVQEVLGYFARPEVRTKEGLLRHDRRYWLFEDWTDLFKGEVPTFLNLWYLLTLRHLTKLCLAARMQAQAVSFKQLAAAHERLVVKRLFDPRSGLFVEGINEKGVMEKRASVHDQTLALMLDLCPASHSNMIKKRLLPFLEEKNVKGAKPSVFWVTYVFEEMIRRGYAGETLSFLRKKWIPMGRFGTTFEGHAGDRYDENGAGSASHAWTAHPSFHLVNILAGLTQTAVAWKEVRFSPCFIPGMDHVRALIPSPQGDISAEWRRKEQKVDVTLSLPRGVMAQIRLPGINKKIAGGRKCKVTVPAGQE